MPQRTQWPFSQQLSDSVLSFIKHLPSYSIIGSPQQSNKEVKQIFLIPILQKSKLTIAEVDHCSPLATLPFLLVTASWFHAQLKDCFPASLEGWCGHIISHWAVSWSSVGDFCEVLKERVSHFFTFPFIYFSKAEMWWLVPGSHYEDKGLLILIGEAVS